MKEKGEPLSTHLGNSTCCDSKDLPCGKWTFNLFISSGGREEGPGCRDMEPLPSVLRNDGSLAGEERTGWRAENGNAPGMWRPRIRPGNMVTLSFGIGLVRCWGSWPGHWTHTHKEWRGLCRAASCGVRGPCVQRKSVPQSSLEVHARG